MSTTKKKMSLDIAKREAVFIMNKLSPYCNGLFVAGSIRRECPEVGDIEIVASSPTDIFSANLEQFDFHSLGKVIKNGTRYKQIDLGFFNLDLFIVAPPAQFGVILAIRTGDADFSKLIVTPRKWGGLLPSDCKVKDGAVWRNGAILEMPSEEDFLKLLGVPGLPPRERTGYKCQYSP